MRMHCPLCQSEADKVRRKGRELTVRFECPECRLRFSIARADLDAVLDRLAAQYAGTVAGG